MNAQEREELKDASIGLAEVIVSLAHHVAMLDGKIDEDDEDLADAIVENLFDPEEGLFTEGFLSEEEEEEVLDILEETYRENPYAMEELLDFCTKDEELAEILLDIAEQMLGEPETHTADEQAFLQRLREAK
ncbi:hypothetical protein [Eisenibacter elegans]|jgi:hypothetical protein|uniref:hypothetical protein n=1 Tax=Eisenibacter elegans TaxID=997 RepID=UPI000414051D|nr:hypothetical protein [Eisenibacter elegans]